MSDVLKRIDRLKQELDALRPLPDDAVAQVGQKLRIESSYHSNAVEGNALTLGETRSLILHGLTARGKPMRDHLDIEGHNDAVKAVEDAVRDKHGLTEVFIRELHKLLLKEPYEVDATAPDGRPARRRIQVGAYKTTPNNVITSTGETYHFTPPEQVKPAMGDLVGWCREQEAEGEHPIIVAATFHYRFVRIHPFDDGNGRMARLLMNMILIRHGYTVAIVPQEDRSRYLQELERADKTEDLTLFIDYIASCCEYSLELHLKAARGESIEEPDDIDREIALFKQSFVRTKTAREQIAARQYVDETVLPFRNYCRLKLKLLDDQFLSSDDFGLTIHYKVVEDGLFDDKISTYSSQNAGDDVSSIPEMALEISNALTFMLKGFRGGDVGFHVVIENKFNSTDCDWTFSLNGKHTNYGGQDLDELKKRFNQLLRTMMTDLRNQMSDAQ